MRLVLMLCLILSGAFCYAHGATGTSEKKGEENDPILIIEKASHGSSEKSNCIHASIDGHCLTAFFTENLGQVEIEITTAAGVTVEVLWVVAPNGHQTYLPQAGDYVVTFTLPNGDEYYGEFRVED